jgi:hypothetical protein
MSQPTGLVGRKYTRSRSQAKADEQDGGSSRSGDASTEAQPGGAGPHGVGAVVSGRASGGRETRDGSRRRLMPTDDAAAGVAGGAAAGTGHGFHGDGGMLAVPDERSDAAAVAAPVAAEVAAPGREHLWGGVFMCNSGGWAWHERRCTVCNVSQSYGKRYGSLKYPGYEPVDKRCLAQADGQ